MSQGTGNRGGLAHTFKPPINQHAVHTGVLFLQNKTEDANVREPCTLDTCPAGDPHAHRSTWLQ